MPNNWLIHCWGFLGVSPTMERGYYDFTGVLPKWQRLFKKQIFPKLCKFGVSLAIFSTVFSLYSPVECTTGPSKLNSYQFQVPKTSSPGHWDPIWSSISGFFYKTDSVSLMLMQIHSWQTFTIPFMLGINFFTASSNISLTLSYLFFVRLLPTCIQTSQQKALQSSLFLQSIAVWG